MCEENVQLYPKILKPQVCTKVKQVVHAHNPPPPHASGQIVTETKSALNSVWCYDSWQLA